MQPVTAMPTTRSPARERREFGWAAAAIVLISVVAYSNSLHGPFVFDDLRTLAENPSIRGFSTALSPPANGMTTSGRPLVNLTFAINHALGGTNVVGYHVANILIHVLAALTLFGLLRRTLSRGHAEFSTALAGATAILWSVHPLQTAAVTYLVQRAESLGALFFLLTLYTFARSVAPDAANRTRWWRGASVLACLAGMAAKEVMVSAPLIVLLYDRTFVAGNFRSALRQRGRYYLSLAATWLLLAALVFHAGDRGGSAGFETNIGPAAYAVTQLTAVSRYLGLTIWPHPLVFDYGNATARDALSIVMSALLVGVLLIITLAGIRRRTVVGFLGAGFFLLLAPSSSVVPIATQTQAEHRMYLALAPVLVLLVLGMKRLVRARGILPGSAVIVALAGLTLARNHDYRSAHTLWADTVGSRPSNPRAHFNLGQTLAASEQHAAAVASFERAVTLQPAYAQAHNALGLTLPKLGRIDDAVRHATEAVRLAPHMADAQLTLGAALIAAGRTPEAIVAYQRALTINPDASDIHTQVGLLLARAGRPAEALTHFEHAARLAAASPTVLANLGNALLLLGRIDDAIERYEAALRLRPDDEAVRANLNLAREARTSRR
jgi:Flp pilus assembly protein TadD